MRKTLDPRPVRCVLPCLRCAPLPPKLRRPLGRQLLGTPRRTRRHRRREELQGTSLLGFQRFKAEVGLAELAFYGLRCCRLGVPKALWPQLWQQEQRLEEALRRRSA